MNRREQGLRLWTMLVEPSAELSDTGDRERARLLSALLIVLLVSGSLSGIVQLWLIEGFADTFRAMAAALFGVGVAYGLSRTARYRAAVWLSAAMIIGACMAVGAQNSADRVWYAFMLIAVLIAAAFLRLRAALVVACAAALGVAVTVAAVPALWAPDRWLPPLMLHAILSPLVLLLFRNRDRVERKRIEQLQLHERQLFEARRLEALGRMASGVAHDFNNLLTVVLVNAELLRARPACSEPLIDDIRTACEQAARLVRQLQAFARGQKAELRAVDLNQVVQGLRPVLERLVGSGVALQLELASDLHLIKADPAQLEQVVLNLVVNARDAMPNGGVLTIATARADATPASGAQETAAGVVLRVADTGVGMDEATQASIFEPFFTTKEGVGGTGLGLAIVQRIALQSGGTIRVESAPGRGSTFEVVLPGERSSGEGPSAATVGLIDGARA